MLGQYLRPSLSHLPIDHCVTPEEFDQLAEIGTDMGFTQVASGSIVRSSYHADLQAEEIINQKKIKDNNKRNVPVIEIQRAIH